MTEKDKIEQVLTELKEIKYSIKNISESKSEKLAATDDSLFFGMIITLIAITIPLPSNELFYFIQALVQPALSSIEANNFTMFLKGMLFVVFITSSVARYYAAVTESKEKSQTLRYHSLELLVLGLVGVIYILIFSLAGWLLPNISASTFKISLVLLFFSIALLISTFVIFIILKLEKSLLRFYKKQELIPVNAIPYISISFALVGFGLAALLFYLIVLAQEMFGFYSESAIIVVIAIFIITSAILLSIKIIRDTKVTTERGNKLTLLRSYWVIVISVFLIIALISALSFLVLPPNTLLYDIAVSFFSTAIFTVLTVVFLSVLLDIKHNKEWKPVKELVFSNLKIETGSLTNHIFNYIEKTPIINSLEKGTYFDIADDLPENIELNIDDTLIPIIFHKDSLWQFSEPQKELAAIQEKYSELLSPEMIESLVKINDYLTDIQDIISIEISQQEINEEQIKNGLNPDAKRRLEVNKKVVALKSKMLLLEIKKLRSILH